MLESDPAYVVGDAMMMRRTSSSEQTRNSVIDELTVWNDEGGETVSGVGSNRLHFTAEKTS